MTAEDFITFRVLQDKIDAHDNASSHDYKERLACAKELKDSQINDIKGRLQDLENSLFGNGKEGVDTKTTKLMADSSNQEKDIDEIKVNIKSLPVTHTRVKILTRVVWGLVGGLGSVLILLLRFYMHGVK